MLRVDVPETLKYAAFTKYLSTIHNLRHFSLLGKNRTGQSGIAASNPVRTWNVEQHVLNNLRQKGLLLEHKPIDEAEEPDDRLPF